MRRQSRDPAAKNPDAERRRPGVGSGPMRILGIDPGSRVLGFGCLDLELAASGPSQSGTLYPALSNQVTVQGAGHGPVRLVDAGVVRAGTSETSLAERLLRVGAAMDQLLARLKPAVLALEEAFFGKSVPSALRIGEARGVVILCGARAGVPIAQYPPARVKRAVTGGGAADKAQVGRWVQHYFGLRTPVTPLDASDALAVALCHAFALSQPLLGAGNAMENVLTLRQPRRSSALDSSEHAPGT